MDDVDRIKRLATRSGFIDLFYSECDNDHTYKDTFERLNDEYEDVFGTPRYSDYNSFRNSRDRR